MDISLITKICERVVADIFSRLSSLKIEIEEEVERTDSGLLVTRTIEVKFKREEDQEPH